MATTQSENAQKTHSDMVGEDENLQQIVKSRFVLALGVYQETKILKTDKNLRKFSSLTDRMLEFTHQRGKTGEKLHDYRWLHSA